jgi:hypothetical protein
MNTAVEPTLTRKPPSNQTLIVLRFSPLATSELLRRSDPEEPIPLLRHLRFASALFNPQNALCRWPVAVHFTAFLGAPIHSHHLPFCLSGLGLLPREEHADPYSP